MRKVIGIRCITLAAYTIIFSQLVSTPRAYAQENVEYDKHAQRAVQLFQDHCVKCHNDTVAKSGVDFADFESPLAVWNHRATFTNAADMLQRGDMPPEDEPPLADSDREFLVGWLEHTLANVDVNQIPRDPGFMPPRRLTRWEYTYTIQDLFGIDLDPGHILPPDQTVGDGFDNDANLLTVEPLWFERSLEAADETVQAVWRDSDALSRLLVAHPSPPPPAESAQYVIPPELAGAYDTGDGNFTVLARILGNPQRLFLRAPPRLSFGRGTKELALGRTGVTYRIQSGRELRANGVDFDFEEPRWLGLSVLEGRAALFYDGEFLASRTNLSRPDMEGQALKIGYPPSVVKYPPLAPKKEKETEAKTKRKEPSLLEFIFLSQGTQDDAMAAITGGDRQAMEQEPSLRWVPGMESPLPDAFITPEVAGAQVIEHFLERAFRRTPTPAELGRYTKLFETSLAAGIRFDIALQRPIAAALAAPAFLYRVEEHAGLKGIEPVPSSAMASRLSYFLWSSMPDDALREAGIRGELSDERALLRHAERMLADPKAERLFERFVLQWLRTEGLGDTIRPDADRFPEVSDSLLFAMRRESAVMFKAAVREDRSLLSLLEGDTVFVNDELAAHYGMEGVSGPDWREIELQNSPRGGLLTQAAALTVSSSPRRTSPVFRGKWVLDVLLGEPPPPPPPDVPELSAAAESNATTLRQLLEAHRSQKACAGCHSRIDPYGLAMEQFDAVGRLRTEVQDTRTTLFDGEPLDGVDDLKRYLVKEKGQTFVRHVTKRLLSYALGRELALPDERTVQSLLDQLEQHGLGAKTLVRAIVLSEPFRYRNIK